MIYEQDKFNAAIGKLMEVWQVGGIADKVTKSIIARTKHDRPSSTWSIGNRMMMFIIGNTDDARGINQWNSVKRKVKKGEKAFYIWSPLFKKYKNDKDEEISYCYGFKPVPVFAKETTEGEEIKYPDHTPAVLPPLYDVAKQYGIEVNYVPYRGFDSCYISNSKEKIELGTTDHADFIKGLVDVLYSKRNADKEVKTADYRLEERAVKDLTCAVICELYNISGYTMIGWDVMQEYFERKPEEVLRVMVKLMAETEAIVSELFNKGGE